MTQLAQRFDASQSLTLEEIGKLAAERGKPAETLMNVVALIANSFRSGWFVLVSLTFTMLGSGGRKYGMAPRMPLLNRFSTTRGFRAAD